ncbi:hypothetical protein [Paraburkholderia diazotrophica]|uniref:hypothetical protein n=1 Tax=Paraburkholderia diazotrophica TaxID=667676 RepID=UPI00317DD3E4
MARIIKHHFIGRLALLSLSKREDERSAMRLTRNGIQETVRGTAASVIVGRNPAFYEHGVPAGKLIGGGKMPVMHLAKAVGGVFVLGFLSAQGRRRLARGRI